jgi:hypothetical protein
LYRTAARGSAFSPFAAGYILFIKIIACY